MKTVFNEAQPQAPDILNTPEADRIHFAVLAIEAAARKMDITPAQMRARLKKQGLIDRLILGCYGVFHTMSLEHVAEDVVEALRNWEADIATTKQEGGAA